MIEYVFKTTRQFHDFEEFRQYCNQMKDSGVFSKEYWDELLSSPKQAEFRTKEPVNDTEVYSRGIWYSTN